MFYCVLLCCTVRVQSWPQAGRAPSLGRKLRGEAENQGLQDQIDMGGCQNHGPFLGVHTTGGIDIDVDVDTQHGWLSKFWSLFGSNEDIDVDIDADSESGWLSKLWSFFWE